LISCANAVRGKMESRVTPDPVPGSDHRPALAERVPSEPETRTKEVEVTGALAEVRKNRAHPDTGYSRFCGQGLRARLMEVVGAENISIQLIAQSRVQRQIGAHLPIVLDKEAHIVVVDVRHEGRTRRGRAFDGDGDGNMKIVDHAVAVQVLSREVLR